MDEPRIGPTHPFADAGLVQASDDQWLTPDHRWGIQVRRYQGKHFGWDVFTTVWEGGELFVEAIHAKGCDTMTEAVEALRWEWTMADVRSDG